MQSSGQIRKDSPFGKKKTELVLLLKGDTCAEFCGQTERSDSCTKPSDCKQAVTGWFRAEEFVDQARFSFRQYYPKRKWEFLSGLSGRLAEFCRDESNGCTYRTSKYSSGFEEVPSKIEIKIDGFDREMHWSLYLSSFSLLVFPGYFQERLDFRASKTTGENGKVPLPTVDDRLRHWFGWIFFLWGPMLSDSVEDLFFSELKQTISGH
ncbi:hypothetical protein EHO60_01845 [Leptospira fletcheri]|uniref:Uncharacterized protein n=1 Tax=Leptospira fletcheri TaxID=2484981 RepID=A0A4R9GK83_9LEPT|nr:hypothetical protein [Leptospira fletcheri]TGK14110.1 hypothetical protein EHO60_01845 [Leptospira fletcheri]